MGFKAAKSPRRPAQEPKGMSRSPVEVTAPAVVGVDAERVARVIAGNRQSDTEDDIAQARAMLVEIAPHFDDEDQQLIGVMKRALAAYARALGAS